VIRYLPILFIGEDHNRGKDLKLCNPTSKIAILTILGRNTTNELEAVLHCHRKFDFRE